MIFNVEKRKKRKGAKILESRSYYLRYRLGEMPADKWVSLKTSDKVVANAKAEKFRIQKELELAGLALPPLQITARKAPRRELLADYIAEMTSQRRDGRYVKGTMAQLERLTGETRWRTLADVTSDSFLSWRRANATLSAKTLNEYRGSALKFLDWLVGQERLAANPLGKVGKIDGRNDIKRERRAYTLEELGRLFAVSEDRAIVYKTAFYTGLRKDELRELQWGDIRKSADGVFLQLRASTTKNGKADRLPLPAKLAGELEDLRPASCSAADKVFATVPRMPRFYKDLKLAGIPRVDEHGRVSDFHAFRKSLSTALLMGGTVPRVAQELMRHSDLKLTTGTYTDARALPLQTAVESLPWLGDLRPGYTQISAQISDFEGRSMSQADTKPGAGRLVKPVGNKRVSRSLSHPVERLKMVRAAGFEPAKGNVPL